MANIKQRLLASSILVAGLGLYSPLYKQIYQSSIQSWQEHFFSASEPITRRKPCRKTTLPSTGSQIGIATSTYGKKVYQLTDNGIKIINRKTGRQKHYNLPRRFPELSWGTDIAYDSKRDLVSLVSLGGEGYLYRFDARKRRWLDMRSLDNIDIKSLTYDRNSDRYVAWAEDFGSVGGNLLFISGNGELLFQESIGDRMTELYQHRDRFDAKPTAVEIFARGNNIALMTYSGNSLQYVWHYDLAEDTIQLTYKSPKKSTIYSD